MADLSRLCRVQVIGPCASVSLVGRNIRAILHQLGGAFEFFEEQKIYLVSQAANDLNFTFVVDEDQGDRLVEQLHELLIRPVPGDRVLGPTWQQLFAQPQRRGARRARPGGASKRAALLRRPRRERDAAFVYDLETVRSAARALRALDAIGRVHYSMKANPHPQPAADAARGGLELRVRVARRGRARAASCSRTSTPRAHPLHAELRAARGVRLGARARRARDRRQRLHRWRALAGAVPRPASIFVRVDTGVGRGHHTHVRTAGTRSKFGVPLAELRVAGAGWRTAAGARIIGLQAHVGSGIFDVTQLGAHGAHAGRSWRAASPDVAVIDVGGGLGVPERPDQPRRRSRAGSTRSSARCAPSTRGLELWLEPGRYLVAAGRRAAGAGDAAEVQGRGALRRRRAPE